MNPGSRLSQLDGQCYRRGESFTRIWFSDPILYHCAMRIEQILLTEAMDVEEEYKAQGGTHKGHGDFYVGADFDKLKQIAKWLAAYYV
jgi:hypothetical protein